LLKKTSAFSWSSAVTAGIIMQEWTEKEKRDSFPSGIRLKKNETMGEGEASCH